MTLQWFLAAFSAVVAIAAFAAFLRARRLSRRLERLAESYWELRYEQGQLSARVGRLEASAEPQNPATPGGTAAFVPLSSLKKM